MKCSKQLSVTMYLGEHRCLSGYCDTRMGKLKLKIVSIHVIPLQVENMEKVCKILNKV
jgi:hypothetical protein